jgi:ABC-type multidrug transport system ATPase subunit
MIEADRLRKRYGAITAVNGLSFEVEAGETFALIGPNGAGKTTTLKLLLGLVRPDEGWIAIGPDRLPPHDARARRHLGYVPQQVEFAAGRTVGEVLVSFSDIRGLPRSAVARALGRVGLQGYGDRRASELSGGYVQRLSLAQALLGDPSLLVLDEPTASLDPEATWEFRSLIEQLRNERVTILLCSHLLAEVERVADRVLILVDGACAALERLDALRARQAGATRLAIETDGEVSLRRAGQALASQGIGFEHPNGTRLVLNAADGRGAAALETLRTAGVPVRSFEVERPTLEDIFLSVVRKEKPGRNGARRLP